MSKSKGMFTLNFKHLLKDETGKEIEAQSIGKVLAFWLARETTADQFESKKLEDWHKKLLANEPLVVDAADKTKLQTIIEKHPNMYAFIKWQILDVIENSLAEK